MKLNEKDIKHIIHGLDEMIESYDMLSVRASTEKMKKFWNKEKEKYVKTLNKIKKQ